MLLDALHDQALLVHHVFHGELCTWNGLSFYALVEQVEDESSGSERGPDSDEHNLRLTVRRSLFNTLPSAGESVTIHGVTHTIAKEPAPAPGAAHFDIIVRQEIPL